MTVHVYTRARGHAAAQRQHGCDRRGEDPLNPSCYIGPDANGEPILTWLAMGPLPGRV